MGYNKNELFISGDLRRKKILNSIRKSEIFASLDVAGALERAGIDPMRRAETLSIEDYCRLSDELS